MSSVLSELSFDELSLDELTFAELSLDELSFEPPEMVSELVLTHNSLKYSVKKNSPIEFFQEG